MGEQLGGLRCVGSCAGDCATVSRVGDALIWPQTATGSYAPCSRAADGAPGACARLREIARSAPLSRIHLGAPPAATLTSRGEEDPGRKIWARLSRRSGPRRPASSSCNSGPSAGSFSIQFFRDHLSPREVMVAAGGAPGEFAIGGRSERSLESGRTRPARCPQRASRARTSAWPSAAASARPRLERRLRSPPRKIPRSGARRVARASKPAELSIEARRVARPSKDRAAARQGHVPSDLHAPLLQGLACWQQNWPAPPQQPRVVN
jgi:hypothetical protein